MASNRLVHQLADAFKNPDIALVCRRTSTERIRRNDTSRAFDDFPISQDEMQILSFRTRLTSIRDHLGRYGCEHELSYWIKLRIKNLTMDMIDIACQELFDDEGNIKPALIKMLHWQAVSDHVDVHALVSGYISCIIPQIFVLPPDAPQEGATYNAIILNYINKNLLDWIKGTYSRSYHPNFLDNLQRVAEDPRVSVPAGLGVLLFFGGIVAAVKYAGEGKNENVVRRI